jgi:hypothetical protein
MENLGKIYQPFGPRIGKFKISQKFIDQINQHIDLIIKKDTLDKELDFGKKLVGQVTQEIELTHEFLSKGLINEFANFTKLFVSSTTKKEISKFKMINSWVVRQFENEYNPIHWHGGHISGVAYLMFPKEVNKINSKTHIDTNGKIQFIEGSKKFLSSATMTVTPKVGDLYLFPHYLMHTVYPFYGKGERRSVSFNAYIDESIFNVHSET